MQFLTDTDISGRADDLVRLADQGELVVVTGDGKPVLVLQPIDDRLLSAGLAAALAVQLHDTERISLARATALAGLSRQQMTDLLPARGIPVMRTNRDELKQAPDDFG
jgi:predicted HTH domain antitoxin